MKKYLFLIATILSFTCVAQVFAKDNKLYFTDSGNRLYYDSALFDDNTFISHNDMVPGQTYEDTLVIENGTNKAYPLYLKVQDEYRSSAVNEILDNDIVEIYLGDKIVYSGHASGLDYYQGKRLVDDVLYLGTYKGNTKETLKVKSTLDKDYTNKNNNVLASVKWDFITVYDDSIDTINPNTGDKMIIYAVALFGMSLAVMISTFIMMNAKEKKAKELVS